ncbi:hypothetical protein CBL_20908 [Carabus blaptoides fortunei]
MEDGNACDEISVCLISNTNTGEEMNLKPTLWSFHDELVTTMSKEEPKEQGINVNQFLNQPPPSGESWTCPRTWLITDRPAARLGYLPKCIESHTIGMNRKTKPRTRTPDPQPSSSAPRAALQRLALAKQKDGAKHNPGPRPISTQQVASTEPTPSFRCGRGYKLQSSLSRHAKECSVNDRRKCLYCKISFPTFSAVRQHERRVHPSEYRKALEDSLPAPESVLMAQIAQIEAASKAGAPKLKEMEQVTGLTAHMVRYRREKPEYKKFLELAMKERKVKALEMFKAKVPPSAPLAIPSTSMARPIRPNIPSPSKYTCFPPSPALKLRSQHHQSLNGKRQHLPSQWKLTPAKEIMPPAPPAVTTGENITSKRKRESSSPSGTPTPQKSRLIRQNTSPAACSELEMIILEETNTPPLPGTARSVSSPDLFPAKSPIPKLNAHPDYGTDVEILQELSRLRMEADQQLIDTELRADLVDLDSALRAWTQKILPSRQPPRPQKNRPKDGIRGPSSRTTLSTNRRLERAAAYKKCQDLYRHKRSLLANNIIHGTSPSAEEETPSLKDVEDYYARIFEDPSPLDDEQTTTEPHIFVHLPITCEDIKAATSSWKPSAPGPDGITVSQIKSCPEHVLGIMFNIVLYQRDADGIFANTLLLDHYVKARRASGKSYNVVSLDVRKAFDTVLIRRSAKNILHLSGHTGNQFLHASLRDGGLGLTQLHMKIPNILRARLTNLFASDPTGATLQEEPTASFVDRVARLSRKGPPDAYWREEISIRPFSAGLEAASEDKATRPEQALDHRTRTSRVPRGRTAF